MDASMAESGVKMRKVLGGMWNEWGLEMLALGIVPGLAATVTIIQWIGAS